MGSEESSELGSGALTTARALVKAELWLDRANRIAVKYEVTDPTRGKAELVHAYAQVADTWLRAAELAAALEGRIVPPIETADQRYAQAINAQHRRVVDAELRAREEGN